MIIGIEYKYIPKVLLVSAKVNNGIEYRFQPKKISVPSISISIKMITDNKYRYRSKLLSASIIIYISV